MYSMSRSVNSTSGYKFQLVPCILWAIRITRLFIIQSPPKHKHLPRVPHQVSQLYQNSTQAKTIMDWTAAHNLQIQPAFNFFMLSPKYYHISKGFITYLYVQILSWHSVDEAATNTCFISIYFQTNIHSNKASVFFFSIQVFAQYIISTD